MKHLTALVGDLGNNPLDQYWHSGWLACRTGLKPKDCPFSIGSGARAWWMKGYRTAKHQAKVGRKP